VTDWAGIDDPAPARRETTATTAAPTRRLPRPDTHPVLSSVDAGARLVQRHARTLVIGSAVFIVPVVVLNVVAATLAYDRFNSLQDTVVSIPELVGGADATTGVETLLLFLGIYLSGLAVALCGALAAEVVTRHRLGELTTLPGSLRAVGRRVPALAVGWFAGHIWVLGLSPILVLASTTASAWTVALLSPLLFVLVALTLYVSPVIMVERVGPFAAIARSYRLARLRFGTTCGLVLVSGLVGLWIRFGITWLPRLMESTGLIAFGRFGWLVEGVAGQLGMLLAVPVVAAATAWAYLEVRLSGEGLDLSMEANALFGRVDA
jgi:hypothetical protein